MVSLITLLGLDHIHLLEEFIIHYKKLGVDKFCICIHVSPNLEAVARNESLQTAADILKSHGLNLFAVYYGDFFEDLVTEFKDQIRRSLDEEDEWIVWCDVDELQEHKKSIPEVINDLKDKNSYALGGVMFDRVRRTHSAKISNDRSVWENYPVGANITQYIIGSIVQKTVIAHKYIKLGHGNHFIDSDEKGLMTGTPVDYIVPIHHFKWDDSASDRLRLRLTDVQKARHAWWWQFARALDWIAQDSFLGLAGLESYDFADDTSELGAGPFSKNPAYTGGPYWSSYRQLNKAERPS